MKNWLILALIVLPLAQASSLVLDGQIDEACATDQMVLSGRIENSKSLPDVYNLRVESPSGMSAYVTSSVEIDGYGVGQFKLFLSPICLDVGNYDYEVIAESARGERISASGVISIRDCNLMELRVSQDKTQVCNGESAILNILVKNLGNEEQAFSLSTDLQPSIYSLSARQFTLRPFQEGKAVLTLSIPQEQFAQGLLTFSIKSESTYSCGSNSREALASMEVRRCDGMQLEALKEITVQAAGQETLAVFLDNRKTPDVYDLRISCPDFVALAQSRVELGSLEGKSVLLLLRPKVEDVGEHSCTFTAKSQAFRKEYSFGAKIKVVQNYGAKLQMPPEARVCKGESAGVKVKLLNSGKENKYALSALGTGGDLSVGEISLAANSSSEFVFRVSDDLQVGAHDLEVRAASPFMAVKSMSRIIVEDCFASALRTSVQEAQMCAGESGSVKVISKNTGTKGDSYALAVRAPAGIDAEYSDVQAFRLVPSEVREANLVLAAAEGVKPGAYEIEVKSTGLKSAERASFILNILPTETCHRLRLQPDALMKQTGSGVGKSFRVIIANEGKFEEKVELYLKEKPTWAYIVPSSLVIQPNSREEALIYFAPPLNEKLGEYALLLEARGRYLVQDLRLQVQVVALETAAAAEIDLSALSVPAEFEEDVETPLTLKIRNAGETELHGITLFFSELVSVVEQAPFNLGAGESRDIRIVVKIEPTELEGARVSLGAYAAEGFAEREIDLKITESALEISQAGAGRKGDGAFEAKLELKNRGNAELKLRPHSFGGANFSEGEIALVPGEVKGLEVLLGEGNETLIFEDATSGKVYRKRIGVGGAGDVTGLFTTSLGRVLPIIIGIVGGAIALYLLVSRGPKLKEKLGGKKDEIEEGEEAEIYGEGEAETDEEGAEGTEGAASGDEEKFAADLEEAAAVMGEDERETEKSGGAKEGNGRSRKKGEARK